MYTPETYGYREKSNCHTFNTVISSYQSAAPSSLRVTRPICSLKVRFSPGKAIFMVHRKELKKLRSPRNKCSLFLKWENFLSQSFTTLVPEDRAGNCLPFKIMTRNIYVTQDIQDRKAACHLPYTQTKHVKTNSCK